ncbi:membrane protein insertion efficiency factor YidD [Telluribacter sp. SYSU D00476]|uniref:membrane protein insertion efficiency factor YidD n=1 Tax=Telluribacter sp. SYSU D00476 TaxID=2811430 RepID=UPI0038F6022D
MNLLLQILIRLYWLVVPQKLKPRCIFKESCSRHVFRISQKIGFRAALKALLFRVSNCRPGYTIAIIEEKIYLITVRGEMVGETELNDTI